ncbi:MAG: helix-turn-helix transcriptional regulator [Deltaproteobacteria bacterium]|nr:helix-turn-helix transcriptional regulator [Deltaproteobacteria bacterium]
MAYAWGMGSPSPRETTAGEERRELILDAALAQFSLRGFDATSIQKVAEAADMSKQALMHHYRSKVTSTLGTF